MAKNKTIERLYYRLDKAAEILGMSDDDLLHKAALAQVELIIPVENNQISGQDLGYYAGLDREGLLDNPEFVSDIVSNQSYLGANAIFTQPLSSYIESIMELGVGDSIRKDLDSRETLNNISFYGANQSCFFGLDSRICFEVEVFDSCSRVFFDRCYGLSIEKNTLEHMHLSHLLPHTYREYFHDRDDSSILMSYFIGSVLPNKGHFEITITREKLYVSGDEVERMKNGISIDENKKEELLNPRHERGSFSESIKEYARYRWRKNIEITLEDMVQLVLTWGSEQGLKQRGGRDLTSENVKRMITGIKREIEGESNKAAIELANQKK